MKLLHEILDFYGKDFIKSHNEYIISGNKEHLLSTLRLAIDNQSNQSIKKIDNVKHLYSYLIHYPECINFGKKFENVLFERCESFLLKDSDTLDEECKLILEYFLEYKSI